MIWFGKGRARLPKDLDGSRRAPGFSHLIVSNTDPGAEPGVACGQRLGGRFGIANRGFRKTQLRRELVQVFREPRPTNSLNSSNS
jgi:hypothetical protein